MRAAMAACARRLIVGVYMNANFLGPAPGSFPPVLEQFRFRGADAPPPDPAPVGAPAAASEPAPEPVAGAGPRPTEPIIWNLGTL
jgi:hypothetical protein